MGKRKLTLAFPPFALSPWRPKSSDHHWGRARGDECVRFRRNVDIRFQGPASELSKSELQFLDMDLEDWMNANHFPPLSLAQKNPVVSVGLPKHYQPDDTVRYDRMKHHKIPPIAMVDSNSIAVGNLPIQFTWVSKDQLDKEGSCTKIY